MIIFQTNIIENICLTIYKGRPLTIMIDDFKTFK